MEHGTFVYEVINTHPFKEGYDFVGWAYSADAEIITMQVIQIFEDTTLYAMYAPNMYHIYVSPLYDTAGTTAGGFVRLDGQAVSQSGVVEINLEYGHEVYVIAEAYEGYEFIGWTFGNGDIVSDSFEYLIEVGEDIQLFAVFESAPLLPGGDDDLPLNETP